MISFWERESFTNYDFIVVGSGIVGLSAAISYTESFPQSRVLVLERGIFPSGASTKNAGFACIGSPTELLSDLQTMTEAEVVGLVKLRYDGLNLLRQRLGDEAIDYQALGSYEILSEKELYCLDRLDELNQLLFPILNGNAFSIAKSEWIEQFGFNPQFVRAMVVNHFEGQIDTGKMMQSLLRLAQQKGITIINGAEVVAFHDAQTEESGGVRVIVNHGLVDSTITFHTEKMAICTNAFVRQLIPDLLVQPGRGQVLVTHPIENLPFKGIFHFDEGYYYFRNFGNRVIFGGGRNLNFNAETTTEMHTTPQILTELVRKLQTLILPHTPFFIDTQWAGIMAFGQDKIPFLKKVSPNVAIGVKLSGMGVAIGSVLGKQIVELLATKEDPDIHFTKTADIF